MDSDRINKVVFIWARQVIPTRNKKNWCARVLEKAIDLGLYAQFDVVDGINTGAVRRAMDSALIDKTQVDWSLTVNREQAIRGAGRNKLRLYRTFKSVYETESYVHNVLGHRQRSALA